MAKGATVTVGGSKPDLPEPYNKVRPPSFLLIYQGCQCAWNMDFVDCIGSCLARLSQAVQATACAH